jgi:hypothetical protein
VTRIRPVLQRRVVRREPDVSEERIASIFRVVSQARIKQNHAAIGAQFLPSFVVYFSTLKIEAIRSSETSDCLRNTRRCSAEDLLNFLSLRCGARSTRDDATKRTERASSGLLRTRSSFGVSSKSHETSDSLNVMFRSSTKMTSDPERSRPVVLFCVA